MLDLAAASVLTDRPEYLRIYRRFLADYLANRDLNRPFWRNRLDSAFRAINLIRAHDLLRCRNDFTANDQARHGRALALEGEFLARDLGSNVGNWEFIIVCALSMLVAYCSQDPQVEPWGQAATNRLHEILTTEILTDGFEIEVTPMYHGQVVLALIDLLVGYGDSGNPPPPGVTHTIVKMIRLMHTIADPSGLIPPVGDSDVLSVSYIENYAAVVLDRLGADADRSEILRDTTISQHSSVEIDVLEDAGWGVVHWPDDDGNGFLLFDAAGTPPPGRDWHSHADSLQILLHDPTGPLLTDPGRFTYNPGFHFNLPLVGKRIDPQGRLRFLYRWAPGRLRDLVSQNWRTYFQGRLAHNTVASAVRGTGEFNGPPEPDTSVLEPIVSQGPVTVLRGAIGDPNHPLGSVRRTVVGFTPWFWLVLDDLEAPAALDWVASWHFVSGLVVAERGNGVSVTRGNGMSNSLTFSRSNGAAATTNIVDDWVSPAYNLKERAQTCRVNLEGIRQCRMATVITVTPDAIGADLPQISWLDNDREAPSCGANGQVAMVSWKSSDRVVKLAYHDAGLPAGLAELPPGPPNRLVTATVGPSEQETNQVFHVTR